MVTDPNKKKRDLGLGNDNSSLNEPIANSTSSVFAPPDKMNPTTTQEAPRERERQERLNQIAIDQGQASGVGDPKVAAQEEQQQTAIEENKATEVEEKKDIDREFQDEVPLTSTQKNVMAGTALIRNLSNSLGIKASENSMAANPEMALNEPVLVRAIYGAVGYATTRSIGPVSFASITAPASASISELEQDTTEIKATSKFTARFAVTKDADVQAAIESITKDEARIRNRYNQANQALRESPQDVVKGVDFMDDARRDLREVNSYRNMLERYSITHDPTEIMANTNDLLPQE